MAKDGQSPREPMYLDDLEVGQAFTTGSMSLDEAAIKAFAKEYDPQPFHLDAEAAGRSLFGTLVASGWHTAAITMRLLVEGGLPLAGGVIGAGGSVKWPRPTYPGDTLSVRGQITEIKPPSDRRPDRGMVTIGTQTVNQRDEVVQEMTATLIVPRRPPGP